MTPVYGGSTGIINQATVKARSYRRTRGWKRVHSKQSARDVKVNYYKLINRCGDTLENIL